MAAAAAYDPAVDGEVVEKYPAMLRHGEHVLKRRFVITEDKAQIRYIYSHHGIYDKDRDHVIQFGDAAHSILGSPYKEGAGSEYGEMPRGARSFASALASALQSVKAALTDLALEVAGSAMMVGCETKVFKSELSYFQSGDGTVLVWEYAARTASAAGAAPQADTGKSAGHDGGDDGGASLAAALHCDRNGEAAAAIARWFARHPDAFGAYHLGRWNCENFASFCKTTDLGLEDLEELKRAAAATDADDTDGGAVVLCRHTLVARSRSRSIQIERLHADWRRAVATEAAHPGMASAGDDDCCRNGGGGGPPPSSSPRPGDIVAGDAGGGTGGSAAAAAAAAAMLMERLLVHDYRPGSGAHDTAL